MVRATVTHNKLSRENSKIAYYRNTLNNIQCTPLVASGAGRFGPRFLKFIRALTSESIGVEDSQDQLNTQHLPYNKRDLYTIRYLGFQFMKLLGRHVRQRAFEIRAHATA